MPLDGDRVELVAGGRDELGLGALAADEDDLGALSPQRVGDRDRRHDVAGRPAGRDHDVAAIAVDRGVAAPVDGAQVRRAAARRR